MKNTKQACRVITNWDAPIDTPRWQPVRCGAALRGGETHCQQHASEIQASKGGTE